MDTQANATRPEPTRCLLLIDDEPAQRRLATPIGARARWWVRGPPDGRPAARVLTRGAAAARAGGGRRGAPGVEAAARILTDVDGPPVDAILLDHWLPGPDGT